jgi:aldose 1-epimerase
MPTSVTRDYFGTTSSGQKVTRYVLKNSSGVVVKILDFGGIITSIEVPDKNGKFDDITTGFDTLKEYESNPAHFGGIIGRIANRISEAHFSLDGVQYQLALNSEPNHIHGGLIGFDKRVWQSEVDSSNRLLLKLVSDDMDEGYPGQLTVDVIYQLNDDNSLNISYSATVADKPTIVNLTNHAYFNLAGHDGANVYDHEVTIYADSYLPKSDRGIPTGEISPVAGTVFDLRSAKLLQDCIHQVHGAPGVDGFDHNFCLTLSSPQNQEQLAARVIHRPTGRILDVYTDQPGIQLYTGNHLDGLQGKGGVSYKQHSSLALETQNYPDAINHTNFPSCVLRPGETYIHKCTYKFTVLP